MMPKLVCMLRVKDGMTFINEWLENMARLVDEIVVVDNGSTDGTYELLKSHPKVVDITKTEGFHEGRDKIMVYEMARKRNPDWCLWLDVDEIFEKRVTRGHLNKLMKSKKVTQYGFRRFTLKKDRNHFEAKIQNLIDQSRPSRFMWKEQPSAYFLNYEIWQ